MRLTIKHDTQFTVFQECLEDIRDNVTPFFLAHITMFPCVLKLNLDPVVLADRL